jgi:hypothetical protein
MTGGILIHSIRSRLMAGYVLSGQTGGANFCFVQGHEARTDPRSEIKSCHAFFPTSDLLSGVLRMTADHEAILLICQPFPGLESSHPKLGSLGEFLPQRFVFLFLMLEAKVRRLRETHT